MLALTPLILTGCTPEPANPAVDASEALRALECSETIAVPAPFGVPPEPEPHAERYGLVPIPFHVHLGLPSNDPSTSMGFAWRTDFGTLATVLEYGVGDTLTERVEGASFTYGTEETGARVHEVRLCDRLEPGTTYSYRVGGTGFWSDTYQFTTPGAPGTFDTFRVAFMGDSRGAYETWGEMLALIDGYDPDLVLFSGDMVQLGPNQGEWDAWFDATGDILARRLLVTSHGNHEFLATNYFAQFVLPNNEQWFSLRYGDLKLVSLNDTVIADEDLDRQAAFMDEVFGAGDGERWRVAMHHRTAYSSSRNHGSNIDVRRAWEPGFDTWGVDLVIAGHNHVYERSHPVRYGLDGRREQESLGGRDPDQPSRRELARPEGTVHIVSGGAGAPLYTGLNNEWFTAEATPAEHFVVADFGPEGIDIVARDRAENVIDQFTIPR